MIVFGLNNIFNGAKPLIKIINNYYHRSNKEHFYIQMHHIQKMD